MFTDARGSSFPFHPDSPFPPSLVTHTMSGILSSSLEAWLNNVYSQKNLRSTALVEFLTVEPEYDFVLDFQSHEEVVKNTGSVRLFKVPHLPSPSPPLGTGLYMDNLLDQTFAALQDDRDAHAPRTPWIPTESELEKQLDVYNLFKEGKEQETYSVPLSKLSEGHNLTAQKVDVNYYQVKY
jgi:hypothetical protein